MIAMMIRSSRGHTGMKLVANRADIAAFLLLQLSAITRVTASIGGGGEYRYWVFASGAMWVLAFLIFAVCYIPSLIASRSPE
jgi:uncharacterized protein involved in response to NO